MMDFKLKWLNLRAWVFVLGVALLLSTSASLAEGAMIFGHNADAELSPAGTTFGENSTTLRLGQNGAAANQARNIIFVFDLTGVGPIESATLELFLVSMSGTPLFNGDLWGVGYSDAATSFPATATFNESGTDLANLMIQDNFVSPTSTTGQYLDTSAVALVTYLNARTDDFVFFRLSQDGVAAQNTFYSFTSADGTSTQLPRLTFTLEDSDPGPPNVIPEPGSLALWGLLLLVGICYWQRQAAGRRLGLSTATRQA